MYIVISSCCAKKDDSVSIPSGFRVVEPSYYLEQPLISQLLKTRKRILSNPLACVGSKTTYAFDLYVRLGRAYKDLFANHYDRVKSLLLSGDVVEWFFLSGGYGIVHALEEVKKYQATFNRNTAYQNKIPYTADLWNGILQSICDSILSKLRYDWVYVFGSRDYTRFIKETRFWKTASNVKMFESTGSGGPNWLKPIINELVKGIIQNDIDTFNSKYGKFTKQ